MELDDFVELVRNYRESRRAWEMTGVEAARDRMAQLGAQIDSTVSDHVLSRQYGVIPFRKKGA